MLHPLDKITPLVCKFESPWFITGAICCRSCDENSVSQHSLLHCNDLWHCSESAFCVGSSKRENRVKECCFKVLWMGGTPRMWPLVAPSQHTSEASAKEIPSWPHLSVTTPPSAVRVVPPHHPDCREFSCCLQHGGSKSCSFRCLGSVLLLRSAKLQPFKP